MFSNFIEIGLIVDNVISLKYKSMIYMFMIKI